MTNTREEYEEWCIETMPRPVALHEIEHGHHSWAAWQYRQEKLQGYKFALDAEQAHVERLEKEVKEWQRHLEDAIEKYHDIKYGAKYKNKPEAE